MASADQVPSAISAQDDSDDDDDHDDDDDDHDDQTDAPDGGVATGGGSASGPENLGLLAAGGLALVVGASGVMLASRREDAADQR